MKRCANTTLSSRTGPASWRGGVRSPDGLVAFTLVEMLLVLIFLSTLAGALAVSLGGRQDGYALQVAAKDLGAAIRFSTIEARLKQLPHRITFYQNLTRYRVETSVPDAVGEYVPAPGQAGHMRRLVEGVRIAAVSTDGRQLDLDTLPRLLVYGPRGDGFHGKIELKNRKGEIITVEVAPGTGQVHVAP